MSDKIVNPLTNVSDTIIRTFPTCKSPLLYRTDKSVTLPDRLTEVDFTKFNNEIRNDSGYMKLSTILPDGISCINPLTGKKIKIGGETYNRVMKPYMIKNYKPSDIANIVISDYLDETTRIINDNIEYNATHRDEIKQYNSLVDIVNAKYKKYSDDCTIAIEQIKKLESWNSYVELNGLKYGIPAIYENIHREHDCMGTISNEYILCTSIVYDSIDPNICFECMYKDSCSDPIKLVFKCSKCGILKC